MPNRLKSGEIEDATMERDHIHPLLLWEHSRHQAALTPVQLAHLNDCHYCVAIFIICQSYNSLRHAKDTLKKHGIVID
jgi:hypothetical protein